MKDTNQIDLFIETKIKIESQFYKLYNRALTLNRGFEEESVEDFNFWCESIIFEEEDYVEKSGLLESADSSILRDLQHTIILKAVEFYRGN